jgi:hypothetical protein
VVTNILQKHWQPPTRILQYQNQINQLPTIPNAENIMSESSLPILKPMLKKSAGTQA